VFSDLQQVPHGGFVTAVFMAVAKAHFNSTLSLQKQPHTIALHLDFLRRTQAGPALFTVRDTKLGRQATVIHVTLSQNSREEVVGFVTNVNMETEHGVTFSTDYQLVSDVPGADSCYSASVGGNCIVTGNIEMFG
jgi:acyl-coenzyme A thioesterase PaaI-like protein